MNDDIRGRIFSLLFYIPAFVAALTVHEFAHAWAGHRLGDDTARRLGRLTLDPMAHLDPFGCLVMVFSVLSRLPLIGWAKPVPFNPRNLEHPRRDGMLIALAGPISNLIQVPIWLLALTLLRLAMAQGNPGFSLAVLNTMSGQPDLGNVGALFGAMLAMGVITNLAIATFNMIPIPPLDGHWILEALGPPAVTDLYNSIRPWSFLLLYALLWTGAVSAILGPVYRLAYQFIALALGFPMNAL